MTTQITKFRQQERIRRLFFKHRGNINAIVDETGFDESYIIKVTRKIKKGFQRDVCSEIASFITAAILEGVEQRRILLEDRLQEIQKKELRSICCGSPISIHTYEQTKWYKCKRCGENCEIEEYDLTRNVDFVRLTNAMRKEDELLAKWMTAVGFVENITKEQIPPQNTTPPTRYVESRELPPAEKKLTEDMKKLPESKIAEIRRATEAMIKKALNEPNES